MKDENLAQAIRNAALDCGFEACGIIRTEEMRGYAGAIADRIAHFPESEHMYSRFAAFAEPERAIPWAKSVVICTNWYGKYRIPEHLHGTIAKSFCVDSRKDPQAPEYQSRERFTEMLDAMGIRHESRPDFGITGMRWAAAKAGIGIIRKNNFLYTEKGSWVRLDSFLIDRDLELKEIPAIKACPEKCGLCIKACPTGALSEPYQMNGPACVSFLMTTGTCAPGKSRYDQCGAWIFGCDACQNVCPYNRRAWSDTDEFPGLEELAKQLSWEQILTMDYETMRTLLPPKFWYIKADDVWKWKCNILNAMHNNFEEKYLPHIEQAAHDTREEVRNMALWVLESVRNMEKNPAL